MKRHRHTPEQVVRKLREGDRLLNDGKDLAEVLRTLEISEATWNRWRNQYGAMKADGAKRLLELESENGRLKKAAGRGRARQGDAQGAGGGKLRTPEGDAGPCSGSGPTSTWCEGSFVGLAMFASPWRARGTRAASGGTDPSARSFTRC